MTAQFRREIFTAIGATALAGIAAAGFARSDAAPARSPASSPDAELLALCARFDALEHQLQALSGDYLVGSPEHDAEDAARDRIHDQQAPLLEQFVAHRATTPAGHQARARSLHLWECGEMERQGGGGCGWNTRMAWALVRDLIAEG